MSKGKLPQFEKAKSDFFSLAQRRSADYLFDAQKLWPDDVF
jgi:hypothetical protein